MSSDIYFFDQYSHTSRIRSFHRSKRDAKDLDQALYHIKISSSLPNDQQESNPKTTDTTLHQLKKTVLPEILTKELDTIFQTFNEDSLSSSQEKFSDDDNSEELNLPRVSLPAELIVQLHSTWFDLIKNTNYKYKVWRTKSGEEAWRQHVKRKRSLQLNAEKQQDICDDKPAVRRRTSSRVSISSISTLSHRQSITSNPKMRSSRSFSRTSFSSVFQDNLHLFKNMLQRPSEPFIEPIKNGIHVEFKLSTQNEQTKQKIARFDIPKPNINSVEDMIIFIQNKCKCLLAETKRKIRETTTTKIKICSFDLRHEIPEKFNIDINIPETKHKCYMELADGSTQIYYPSGRLAVVRLRSPICTTLFYDDIDSPTHQFLGLITSTGSVLIMQPTFHARFVTNNQHDHGYLCNGKTGIIEKQFQWSLSNNLQRKSLPITEDNINPLENTIQLQINSFMQLEYHNSSNILFAFTCQNEEFKLQLGVPLPRQSTTLMNIAATIIASRRISGEKKTSCSTKRSDSVSSNEEKQQITTRKVSDEQSRSHSLPMMHELIILRKRIKHICQNWLKECRTTLGIMHIDAYHLPDLPLQPAVTQTNPEIDGINRSKSAKYNRPQTSLKTKSVQSFLPSEPNVIANAIEQFVPHSDTGRS